MVSVDLCRTVPIHPLGNAPIHVTLRPTRCDTILRCLLIVRENLNIVVDLLQTQTLKWRTLVNVIEPMDLLDPLLVVAIQGIIHLLFLTEIVYLLFNILNHTAKVPMSDTVASQALEENRLANALFLPFISFHECEVHHHLQAVHLLFLVQADLVDHQPILAAAFILLHPLQPADITALTDQRQPHAMELAVTSILWKVGAHHKWALLRLVEDPMVR